ncbi:hypothetical protein D3C78_1463560 [compost metagenome]
MAMAAGTARQTAMVADRKASHKLFWNACMKLGCSNTARNQRSEKLVVGTVRVVSGVNATRHTMASGASTNTTTRKLNASAKGPFFCMLVPWRLSPGCGGKSVQRRGCRPS